MPNPDPTHPKFLEGDEGLSPNRNDDDVEGHRFAMNHPAEDEAGPEGFRAANAPDDLGSAVPDDAEGLRPFE
jgi:hypothetical protein